MMGAPEIRSKASRGRIDMLCHSTSTASAHYGVTVVWRDMHAHEMWKTLRVPRDTRQMCRIQAYKHYSCPRVGYPALGAGHARERGSVHSIRTIAVQSLAVNLYVDAIKFAHLQHQVSFHDLVAPVVHLTTDARCRRGRSHEQSGHQQETAGDH